MKLRLQRTLRSDSLREGDIGEGRLGVRQTFSLSLFLPSFLSSFLPSFPPFFFLPFLLPPSLPLSLPSFLRFFASSPFSFRSRRGGGRGLAPLSRGSEALVLLPPQRSWLPLCWAGRGGN
jgi:hypothetical protein